MTTQHSVPAFLVRARYVIDPPDTPEFKAIVMRMAAHANSQQGCCFLNAAQDVLDPNTFHLVEGWASREAFQAFGATSQFQEALKAALALKVVDRAGTLYFVSGTQALEMPT
jgi:quinol monooxygenase YgiN